MSKKTSSFTGRNLDTIDLIRSEFMITVTLTAVATAIATTLWTKAQEKIGENIGDVTWTLGGKLIEKLRQKNKSPLLTSAVEGSEPQRLDYGQAVLEQIALGK